MWTSFFKCVVAAKELETAALYLIWLIICVTLVGSRLQDLLLPFRSYSLETCPGEG
jgi:hypothetical protein